MVRATRSTTQQQTQKQDEKAPAKATPSAKKLQSKKRKRTLTSLDIDDDEPAAKVPRPEPTYKDVGDLALRSDDAQHILDVLESTDTQGLLDREFPLVATESSVPSTSQDPHRAYSLRDLLQNPANHPLSTIRSAVLPLFPLTSQPRARQSETAAQQARFCNLALSLLDQASRNLVDLHRTSLFLSDDEEGPAPEKRRKYALMQKLPNGDWWTSASSTHDKGLTRKEASALMTGQAELVAILPSLPPAPEEQPLLGAYSLARKDEKKDKAKAKAAPPPTAAAQRKVSSGTFLDYGPYASFAPSFDSDAVDIGRETLGALYYARIARRNGRRIQAERAAAEQAMDVDEEAGPSASPLDDSALDALPEKEASTMREFLADMEVEEATTDLLERNSRAIQSLRKMQLHRLGKGAAVEEGSDEWETAKRIEESLVLLASTRPRVDDSDSAPLIPPPAALRSVHRQLPQDGGIGWKGTLAEPLKTTLRDNTTVRVKVAGTSTKPAPAATAASSTPATPNPYRMPYAFATPPGSTNYYPNAYLQTPTFPPYGYPPPPFYAYPFPPGAAMGRDQARDAAAKHFAFAPAPLGNAAKPPANGWPAGYPPTLPPHLRRGTAAGTPVSYGSPAPGQK